jgi:hypothetical protein
MSSNFTEALHGAADVIKVSLNTVIRQPGVLVYPYLALVFIAITYPLISSSIFNRWYNDIFLRAGYVTPHHTAAIIGLVSFSAFYAAFVTAFFTCAVSATVLAKLEGRDTTLFYGLAQVVKHSWRVARFAVLSVFLLPIGIYAQRRKLPKGIVGVLGSSLTLHMANLAPAILTTHKRFGETVRDSINTLGKKWREGLVLKVGMYVSIFVIVVLPKLIQHHFFTSQHAGNIGWLISLELATSSYVTFKVINAIFTTVLYHQARDKNRVG